ncbi:MAG TPA: hypothetical protein VF609_01065 [Flavisolibacter sp.]
MKLNFLAAVCAIIILCSCGSISSFESPNSLRNISGTLFLANGRSFDGRLVIQTGNLFSSDVKIYADDDNKPMHFDLDEVEGYRIRNDYYFLKEKKGGIALGRQRSFMKRLTPESSRVHLFEDMNKVTETNKANGVTNSRTRYETEYYLQLPNEKGPDVYPLGGSRFVPAFDEKMSRIVSDCPLLAQKIASKQDGYFYAQVSLFKEKKVNVLMNIIEEYNRCR